MGDNEMASGEYHLTDVRHFKAKPGLLSGSLLLALGVVILVPDVMQDIIIEMISGALTIVALMFLRSHNAMQCDAS